MEMHRSPTTAPLGRLNTRQPQRTASVARRLSAVCLALAVVGVLPAAQAAQAKQSTASAAAAAHPSRAYWVDVKGTPASARGAAVSVRATKYRAATLDRSSMAGLLAGAPMEFTGATPLVISLPDPAGGYQRFAIVESPVMEAGLAAKHPDIKTYSGRGIDDPAANLRMDLTPLGFHASVRSSKGNWYIDPHYHLDQSLYSSYYLRDAPKPANREGDTLITDAQLQLARSKYRSADTVRLTGIGFTPGAQVSVTVKASGDAAARQVLYATASLDGVVSVSLKADPYKNLGDYTITATDGRSTASTGYRVVSDLAPVDATAGPTLRTYRLALVTDPSYATYFGSPANVTPAKVTLVNRVTQMYEYDTSIRLVLVANNDRLNFDTTAAYSGTNGACGGAACYTTTGCAGTILARNTAVIGLLIGAGNYDIGHIGFGPAGDGGGVANLGVVGLAAKGGGCTGLNPPVGDGFAIDYVAHEMGHQFAGPHTFNGTIGSCAGGNRSAASSVEPGSGTSIMAYAGICGTNNLQAHSDPYWSFQSFEAVTAHVTAAEQTLNEVQTAALTAYTGAQLFQVRYAGADSVTIGTGGGQPYTAAGIKAAIEGISGWPAGGTVTIGTVTNTGFTVTFGGALAGIDAAPLALVGFTDGASGFINDTTKGGITTRRGFTQTATGNNPPVVTVAGATYTIPVRTPFALTGSAVDSVGDVVTYMWEQTDRGGAAGTSLVSNTKIDGPLFRQFGVRAIVGAAEAAQYNSPGENLVDTNPTRVFPDMAQILANNTNAETGSCTLAVATAPTGAETDCFSEFLPTAAYVGFAGTNNEPSLNFRLTARDGKGGIGNGTTKLLLATTAGPFLVTSPNTAVTLDGFSQQTVTWNVANTNVAPVSTANVKITLSTDGGATFPITLAASTANSGSRSVLLPNVASSTARIKVEAVDNVYFDISNADFTIRLTGDVNSDGRVDCSDLAIIRAAFGSRTFDARADVNGDGVVDLRDLAYVSQRVTIGSRC